MFDALKAALKSGAEVRLPAFGVFAVTETACALASCTCRAHLSASNAEARPADVLWL